MDVKKGHSLKYSLFRYLMVAVVVSIVCSYALQSTADQIRENIWIKYIDDTENFYDFQNAYSEEFESGLPIPSVGTNQMERTDKIMVELCDFISSWGIFILTLFSIFVALSLFYSRRLKKPFRILNDCADRIKKQDLDFEIVYDRGDEMGRLCGAFEQMRSELEINNHRMWDMIEEQRQMRSAFSHDLRTPLTVLKGYVEYLLRYDSEGKIPREKAMEILGDCLGQIDRIEAFCDTMKNINRLDDVEITRKRVSPEVIGRKTEAILEALSRQYKKGYRMEDRLGDGEVCIDMDIYLEIVENIASNAARYARKGMTLCLEEDGDWLYIELEDDGNGFGEEALSEAKKPYFHRTDTGASGLAEQHCGMGLYICDKLAKKHGGSVQLSSGADGGARVLVCLKI